MNELIERALAVLAEQEKRAEAATDPPWEAEHKEGLDTQWFDVCVNNGTDLLSAETEPRLCVVHLDSRAAVEAASRQHVADIEFAAHARTDLPRDVKLLRALLDRYSIDWRKSECVESALREFVEAAR